MKLVEALNRHVDHCVDAILAKPAGKAVVQGTATPLQYARFLVTAHKAVAQADHFLTQSAEQLASEAGDAELVALLHTKAKEESGHAVWIERDLRALGFALGSAACPAATAAGDAYVSFHRSLRAIHGAGAGFLGTAWVLESLSTRLAGTAAENLRAHSDHTALRAGKGLIFLRGHHAEDQDHVAELAALLERCVTRVEDRRWIELCAHFTASVYPAFFA